jgi:hypothetical protein
MYLADLMIHGLWCKSIVGRLIEGVSILSWNPKVYFRVVRSPLFGSVFIQQHIYQIIHFNIVT